MIPITQIIYVIYVKSKTKQIILQRAIGICPYSLKLMILINNKAQRFDDENVLKQILDDDYNDDNVFACHEVECEFYLIEYKKNGYNIITFGLTRELYEKISKTSR
jgi:hypothetical protein